MDFVRGQIEEDRLGFRLGYLAAYFFFTTTLFFLLILLKKMPLGWTYIHIMAITLAMAITSLALARILK